MYLKRLEIQGFKSFADKIKIDFSKDLTMIVGPNGSGKSNILDAIRWVLGEQSSKNLRGQNMADVIFMGTEDRTPVSFASVTIVIDNEDGLFGIDAPEIQISRKYFRTGESKYFLNKTECRLMDVSGILLNTGLAKDGYSIISQGKIDEILSLKSKDRRDFFDEATGVTKYRYKKDEAQKKLENTAENLARLEDILHEKNLKLGPLETQSIKAKQYLELASSLRENQVNLWKFEVTDIDNDLIKQTSDFEICKQDIFENKLSSNKNKLEVEKMNIEISGFDEKISQLDKKQEEEISLYIKNQATIENAKSNIRICESENLRLERDLIEIKDSLTQEKTAFIENQQQIDIKLKEKQNKLAEIQEINKKIAKIETKNYSFEQEIANFKLCDKQKLLEQKEFELRNTLSTINYTVNSIENYDFFPKSIQFVLQKMRGKGIVNTVANEVSTEEKFSLAINTALGAFSNNIIAETSKDAINAIERLKKDKIGFATFLPLDKVSARKTDFSKYENKNGVIGSACDLIKFDKRYENVIFRALGDVLIVENSQYALEINKNDNIKMVTLDGETFHRGGAISGGKITKGLGVFEQKNKLLSLEKQKNDVENLILDYKNEISEIIKQSEEINSQISENLQQIDQLKEGISKFRNENQVFEHILTMETSKQAERSSQIARFEEKITQYSEQILDNNDRMKADNLILGDVSDSLQRLEEFKVYAKKQKDEMTALKEKLTVKIAELGSSSTSITDLRIDLERNFVKIETNIAKLNEKKEEILSKMFDKYDLTYTEMQEFKTEVSKLELLKIVNETNDKIRALGNINLDSIDDYIAIKDEYEDLLVQVLDIKKSKDEVEKLILRIEEEMKDVFTTEFHKIAVAFESTFNDLFGGGYALLELSDPDDALNSGVDIFVCPPGKKEKSLTLLSGGERAFVATAILFAIIKCKPTPFCILDEIDSALDDMNVKKYGQYLEKNSDKTQFLVITHRKGTMHAGKVIYGVTMENKGVSKLLRVNIDEKEL